MTAPIVSSLSESFTAGKATLLDKDIYVGTEKELEKNGNGLEGKTRRCE